jgi:ABC-type transport system involved in cytochrome c biogenesis ATPase subunit
MLAENWPDLVEEYKDRTTRLVVEARTSWNDVHALNQKVAQAFRDATPKLQSTTSTLPASIIGELSHELLVAPLSEYSSQRPLNRYITCIEHYDIGLDDLVHQLSGSVRDEVSDGLAREAVLRSPIESDVVLLIAQSLLRLLTPWNIARRSCSSPVGLPGQFDAEFDRWLQTTGSDAAEVTQLLEKYSVWANKAEQRMCDPTHKIRKMSGRRRRKLLEKRKQLMDFRLRLERAVHGLLDIEHHLALFAAEATALTTYAVKTLEREHHGLVAELDAVISALETWQVEKKPRDLPQPEGRLISSEERASEWVRYLNERLHFHIPDTVECVTVRGVRRPRIRWRQLELRSQATRSFEEIGRPLAQEAFKIVETVQTTVVREIERAREVVEFGVESSQLESDRELIKEALSNALSLLLHQRKVTKNPIPSAEEALSQAQAAVFLDIHTRLEVSRLGAIAYATRQGGLRAAERLLVLATKQTHKLARATAKTLRSAVDWALVTLGWVPPPTPKLQPVEERARLSRILEIQLGARDLPALYRRLFRIEPVEDARFLIGRDAELAGLSRALDRWRAGTGAAILIVGDRGSGKTSLLNCTLGDNAQDESVVRAQFSQRLTTTCQLEKYLSELLAVGKNGSIDKALRTKRRIVMLEEVERTFLRTMNGFEAIRTLSRLIETTSSSTLWILSTNSTAFRYLQQAVTFDRTFGYRINAMAVSRGTIIHSIMQRHNLSGLRLQFAPLPEGDPRIGKVKRLLSLEPDPQEVFFAALYGQSGGVFRASLELWQDCIDRVEGGVVQMRQPLSPNYRSLSGELDDVDALTIQAFMQHGGLTESELSEVFGIAPHTSERRIARMLDLEIIEPEPCFAGFRVRPQAWRFVREVLHGRNLA